MKFGQPLKLISDAYNKLEILRELEWIHKRVNEVFLVGEINLNRTLTPVTVTDPQTINKIAGTFRLAAGETSKVVNNSFVTLNSLVFCTIRTNDATALLKNVVCSDGFFTARVNAAVTAETEIAFWVVN